jgi:hypothetical protein
MHLSRIKISIISNELSQASTWASLPRSTIWCFQNDFWAYSTFSTNHAPILHQHQYYLQMDQNKIPHDPRHLRVPSGASKTTSEAMIHLSQTTHLSCIKISYIFERTRSSFHLSLVTKEYHRVRPRQFSEPVVHSVQTVHLSCVKISTIFDWTESSFHVRLVTMHLSCVKISIISNELSQASTWASLYRISIRCVQNNLWAYGMFSTNYAPILHQH